MGNKLYQVLDSLLALAVALFILSASAPTIGAQTVQVPAFRTHVVQSGDTLRRLAVQYETTAEEIVDANQLPYPYTLSVGQRLDIPAQATSLARTPEQTVEKFYNWYATELELGNRPLASGLYQASPYLADSFKQAVDEELVNAVSGSFDPFLCGQDAPGHLTVDRALISTATVRAIVHTGSGQAFTVALVPDGQSWKISGVACAAD